MTDYFKNFATPKKFIAVDASASNRFSDLQSDYPDLILFHWPKQKSNRETFEQLVNIGIENVATIC